MTFKSSPLKPLSQIKSNLAGMVPGWVPFKIVSDFYGYILYTQIGIIFCNTTSSTTLQWLHSSW
jgi:hypothetical protein